MLACMAVCAWCNLRGVTFAARAHACVCGLHSSSSFPSTVHCLFLPMGGCPPCTALRPRWLGRCTRHPCPCDCNYMQAHVHACISWSSRGLIGSACRSARRGVCGAAQCSVPVCVLCVLLGLDVAACPSVNRVRASVLDTQLHATALLLAPCVGKGMGGGAAGPHPWEQMEGCQFVVKVQKPLNADSSSQQSPAAKLYEHTTGLAPSEERHKAASNSKRSIPPYLPAPSPQARHGSPPVRP